MGQSAHKAYNSAWYCTSSNTPLRPIISLFFFKSLSAAGLKCRSQVTGQVTGYRPQATGQVTGHRSQATGHRSQATGQVTGHTKNNRTLDKTVLD